MGYYQGRALEARRPRRPSSLPKRIVRVFTVGLVLAVLTQVPWRSLRRMVLVVTDLRVEGTHYLDADRVLAIAHLAKGEDLLAADPVRARQSLLLDSRIASATVARRFPRGLVVRVVERTPVVLVAHGEPWEMDAAGVLLAPLQRGVVADVPMLVGPRFDGQPAGTRVSSPAVVRGLKWVEALSNRELQLQGQVSEVDVSDETSTGLTLLTGTRVLAPAWPPSTRRLSALRVVLADLGHKGTTANEVDLRYEHQVIVRPAETTPPTHSG